MKLSRISLKDYRAYPVGVMNVPESGVVLVAGANNSGKSAFLSVFDAVLQGAFFTDMGYGGAVDWRIAFTFVTTDNERERFSDALTQFGGDIAGRRPEYVEVTFAPFSGQATAIEVKTGPDVDSMTTLARFERESGETLLASVFFGQGTGGELQRVEGITPALNFGHNHPVGIAQEGVGDLRQGFYHIQALRQGAPASTPFSSTPTLQPEGANLAGVLRHLRDNEPYVFAQVAKSLSALVPELGDLAFRSGGNNDEVVFDDASTPGLRQNLQNLGTGVEQLLLTLIVGIAQPQARTILIEEPETALEAGAQRALLGLLQQWSRSDRLFIVSTHSTAMIDWSSAASGQLYHVQRRDGRSSIKKVDTNFRDLLDELGVRLSDVMSAETILVVEGTTDRDLLGIFFPRLVQTPSIAVVPGGGGGSDRLAHIPKEWLDKAEALEGRRIHFLRDRDELSPDQVAQRENKHVVRVLPCREIENFLLDASALREVWLEQSVDVPVEDIEVALQAAADELKERVVLGRVWWQLPTIRLVDHNVRKELANDPDKLDKLIGMVSEALPDRMEMAEKIKSLWSETQRDIEAEWSERWRYLAPGADVLSKVYKRFLGRGYSKDTDGAKIARAIGEPPEELRKLLADLVTLGS